MLNPRHPVRVDEQAALERLDAEQADRNEALRRFYARERAPFTVSRTVAFAFLLAVGLIVLLVLEKR